MFVIGQQIVFVDQFDSVNNSRICLFVLAHIRGEKGSQ